MARLMTKRQPKNKTVQSTALYVRVSTEKKEPGGYSLEEQQKQLAAYCKAKNWAVAPDHIYVDTAADRPAFQAMLAAARRGDIARVVATQLDRIAGESLAFHNALHEFGECGVILVLLNEDLDSSTPQGKFCITARVALAEYEASVRLEQNKAARLQSLRPGPEPV